MTYDPEYEVRDGIRRGEVRPLDNWQQHKLADEVQDRMSDYGLDARDALEDEVRTHPREWSGAEYRREQQREEEREQERQHEEREERRRHEEWLEEQEDIAMRDSAAYDEYLDGRIEPPPDKACDRCEAGNVPVLGWHEGWKAMPSGQGVRAVTARNPCARYRP